MRILAPPECIMAAERLVKSEKIGPLVKIYSRQDIGMDQCDQ